MCLHHAAFRVRLGPVTKERLKEMYQHCIDWQVSHTCLYPYIGPNGEEDFVKQSKLQARDINPLNLVLEPRRCNETRKGCHNMLNSCAQAFWLYDEGSVERKGAAEAIVMHRLACSYLHDRRAGKK